MISIRRIELKDLKSVCDAGISEKRFSISKEVNGFWTMEQLRSWIKNDSDVCLLAEENGALLGFILSQLHTPTGKACIENIYVFPDHRGKGVGSKLAKSCLKELNKNGAKYYSFLSEIDNLENISLWKKLGFNQGKTMTLFDK